MSAGRRRGEPTSRTLLERVRDPDDREAWERFFALYEPMIARFVRLSGLAPQDAEEVRGECLAVLAAKLPSFGYDRARGGFRGWLYQVVRGKVIDHLRRQRERRADSVELGAVSDPSPGPDEVWDRVWREEHLRFALEECRDRVSERTWQTFQLLLLEGASVPQVCERMGMNANQVYKAKARALQAVREVIQRLGVEAEPEP